MISVSVLSHGLTDTMKYRYQYHYFTDISVFLALSVSVSVWYPTQEKYRYRYRYDIVNIGIGIGYKISVIGYRSSPNYSMPYKFLQPSVAICLTRWGSQLVPFIAA